MQPVWLLHADKNSVERSQMSFGSLARHKAMDSTEFKQRLSAVADWIIPNDKQQNKRQSLRRQALAQKSDINHTVAMMLTGVKTTPEICPDCDKVCEQGRRLEIKLYQWGHKRAWRQRCVTCNLVQDPFTGSFTLAGSNGTVKWDQFMRSDLAQNLGKRNK